MTATVLFRDDFAGSGSLAGRPVGPYTWSVPGGAPALSGGKLTFPSGGSIQINALADLTGYEHVEIEFGLNAPSSCQFTLSMCQNPASGNTGIGNGWRHAYNAGFDQSSDLVVNNNVTHVFTALAGNPRALRYSFASTLNAVSIFSGTTEGTANTVYAAPTTSAGVVGQLYPLALRIAGNYGVELEYVVCTGYATPPPDPTSGRFWTSFRGSREIYDEGG